MSKVGDSRERSVHTVKCKVFDIARRQSKGRAFRTSAEIGSTPGSLTSFFLFFSLSLSFSFFLSDSVPVANYFTRNRLETKKLSPSHGAPSRCFVMFRNINYAVPVKLYTRMVRRRRRRVLLFASWHYSLRCSKVFKAG